MRVNTSIRTLVGGVLLGLALASLGLACRSSQDTAAPPSVSAAPKIRYHCPMHPSYVADKPGDCPICNMSLVPIEPPASQTTTMPSAETTANAATATGRSALSLSPEQRQLLGIRSEELRLQPLVSALRAVGRVAPDERRIYEVHAKFEGYAERMYADFTGRPVQRGERLLSIYSPELLATQKEYLLALRAKSRLAQSRIDSVAQGGVDLLAAARERLRLWDVADGDIAAIERSGQPLRAIDLRAERGGFILRKNVITGQRIMPADALYEIADLSHLWILADIAESDLAKVRLGMTADITLPADPARHYRGAVSFIAPTVAEDTRTATLRIEVDNPAGALKLGLFADVALAIDLGSGLLLPESAAIDAGDRKLVFIDRTDGHIEPREVQLGDKLQGGYRVFRGVRAGERVITSASFLLDSESSLKSAMAELAHASEPRPSAEHRH